MPDPNKPSIYTGWTEPESVANTDYQPLYPYNNVQQTKAGHSIELDDTPGRERVRFQHGGQNGSAGTFIEWHPNGDEVHKIIGDGYEIILNDKNMLVTGKLNITVQGDAYLNIEGDKIEQINGNYEQHVQGNYTQVVEGLTNIISQGDMTIFAGGAVTGALRIGAGDHVQLNCDLSVDGEVTATKITSKTRIDAGTGISAGALGFVSLLGGLSVGIPVAVPGTVLASTLVNAPFLIGTTMTYGSVLMDPMGGAPLIRSIYDSHSHIGNRGFPTSSPLQLMPLP